jgi:hypothetical protein
MRKGRGGSNLVNNSLLGVEGVFRDAVDRENPCSKWAVWTVLALKWMWQDMRNRRNPAG